MLASAYHTAAVETEGPRKPSVRRMPTIAPSVDRLVMMIFIAASSFFDAVQSYDRHRCSIVPTVLHFTLMHLLFLFGADAGVN
jgi:hypothetical protein